MIEKKETVLRKNVHHALLGLKDSKAAIDELKHSSIFTAATSYEKQLLEAALENVDESMQQLVAVRDYFAKNEREIIE